MTYNVFSGTLSPTQSINQPPCTTTDESQKVKGQGHKVTQRISSNNAIGNGWSYQLQTWWKLSARGAHHATHFLGQ